MQELFNYLEQFVKLSKIDKQAISETCSIKKVNKQEIIEAIGGTSKALYFVKSGVARTYYYKNGIEITEYFALQGNLVARAKSLLTNQSSVKAIQILEAGELIVINATSFFKLFDRFPNIERLYRLLLESAYLDIVNRLESIQFHSAKERYEALVDNQELIQKVPLKYIASYLGITQVSLSRIRANHSNLNF